MFSLPRINPPAAALIEPIVRAALAEDLGRAGDITTDNIIEAGARSHAVIAVREPGVMCGLVAAEIAFRLLDPNVKLTPRISDGGDVKAGDVIAGLDGPARAILTGERAALNFIGHLSGVATATRALVDAVKGTKARITCTRKTTPGLRILEKYAVRCGGGINHRFGLDDAILIKDNHIAAAGGIERAVAAMRGRVGHMTKIEVEVDSLDQLEAALALGVDTILLDNMTPEMLTRAVALTKDRAVLEASGGVTLATVRAIAETGVDYISSGAITHSARNLDVGLDFA